MQLQNKTALITGASSGIGKETALLFAKEGALVVLTARNIDKLKEVENEIKNNNGKAESYSMDITDRNQVYTVISQVIKDNGRIDILVNSAGIVKWSSIEDTSYEDFDEQVKFNLTGSFNTIKETAPIMIKQKSGNIVNIITSTVKKTKSGRVAYAASKYGQAGLSNAVHEDLKDKGISVVAVYPSKTNTPIHDPYMSKDDPQREKMLKPEKVAEVVLEAALIPTEKDVKELVVNP
ncbi:MAG: SDR family oxidoreductase [Candidatus Woesearchaeota archaeon]|jgi:short-subunit dehydrogenase|nr:SDR family oxidoreductase [Candidatus Woesearchaeota archaeon]MDP7322428.1 SDR family oxidoreductase [Candidatus Woesearchaeota archaeon]HJO01453.1 SDR family oxidoreductase [Candidatus Woesearchaeota archaeon]